MHGTPASASSTPYIEMDPMEQDTVATEGNDGNDGMDERLLDFLDSEPLVTSTMDAPVPSSSTNDSNTISENDRKG